MNYKLPIKFYFLIMISSFCVLRTKNNKKKDSKKKDDQNITFENVDERDSFDKIKSKLSKDWEFKLKDFFPEHYYTFDIPGKKKVTFFEEFDNVPVEIQGAFFSSSDSKESKLFFIIRKENGQIINSSTTNEIVFKHKINKKGTYSFIFDNRFSDKIASVTFTTGTMQNQIMTSNQLDNTRSKIKKLETFMKSVFIEEEFVKNKFKDRVKGKKK